MSAVEFIEKSIDLRKRGRADEALIAARQAVALDSTNANAFWQAAVCHLQLKDDANAIGSLEKVTELAPDFAQGWSWLGLVLLKTDRAARAKECLERAVELDREDMEALVKLASMYEADKQAALERRTLLSLKKVVDLTAYQLNRLGILSHEKGHHSEAISYFRRVASVSPGPAGFFNLGLTLSKPEINQRTDAIDAWRRALKRDPAYERAANSISDLLPDLLDLRRRLQARSDPILDRRHWYSGYVNPFELLRIGRDILEDEPDAKAKRRGILCPERWEKVGSVRCGSDGGSNPQR